MKENIGEDELTKEYGNEFVVKNKFSKNQMIVSPEIPHVFSAIFQFLTPFPITPTPLTSHHP